ncbi:hypothetical protein OQA88_8389 [Cercophora sp. LCS_1]
MRQRWNESDFDFEERRRLAGPQTQSLFFTMLPQEMRDMVYAWVLELQVPDSHPMRVGPEPQPWEASGHRGLWVDGLWNRLALLRVCRRTTAEIGTSWIANYWFMYERVNVMLDKLCALDAGTLSQIKHLCVEAPTDNGYEMGTNPRGDLNPRVHSNFLLDNCRPYKLSFNMQLDSFTMAYRHWGQYCNKRRSYYDRDEIRRRLILLVCVSAEEWRIASEFGLERSRYESRWGKHSDPEWGNPPTVRDYKAIVKACEAGAQENTT